MDKPCQADCNWVKVALKVNHVTQLTKLNVNQGVEDILQQICVENGIGYVAGKYALKVHDFSRFVGTEYVTEENKIKLKHGMQLKLSKSPAKRASKLIDRLHGSKDQEASLKHLNNLASASGDSVILRALHSQNVLQNLRVFASVRELSPDEYHKHYKVIGHLLAGNYISGLNEDEIGHLTSMIIHKCKTTREMLILSFEMLILLRKKGKLHWPTKFLRKLSLYVRLHEDRKLQERSLQLINYLYLFASDSDERKTIFSFMNSSLMITYITEHMIGESLTNSMKHQLYMYQKIILRKYNKHLELLEWGEEKALKDMKFAISNAGMMNQLREISSDETEARERKRWSEEETRDEDKTRHILCSLRASLTSTRRRSTSAERDEKFRDRLRSQEGLNGSENDFLTKKIHFKRQNTTTSADGSVNEDELPGIHDILDNVETESIETMKEGVSALTRDNLCYYAINDFKNFEKLLLIHKNCLRSVLHVGIEITNLLCKIFEIHEKEPYIKRGRFVPLCFLYYDQIIERLFVITLKLFHKTRQEMKVAIDSSEYPMVLKAVEDKLLMGLEAEPVELQELEMKLDELGLDVVLKKREEAIREDIERLITRHPGLVELKEIITPRILRDIQEKRLRFMKTGEHVPQFDYKGQKIGEKMWFIYVPNTQDKILIEECSTNPCTSHHKTLQSISISDIREVEYGIKSNFHKEVYFNLHTERDMFFRAGMKQQELAFEFPISLKLQSLCYIDFCAGNALSMDYWIDGISFLIGEKMSSETMAQEFNFLLDIQLMSHLAELEGLKIPEKPPIIPAPPNNYDFALP